MQTAVNLPVSPHALHLIWKSKLKNQNPKLKIKIVYNHNGYIAQVTEDGTCVVHRTGEHVNGQVLNTHIGEKLPSQDWREVRLMGCPHEVRVAIIEAWQANR